MYTDEHVERTMVGVEELRDSQIRDLREIVFDFLKSYRGNLFQEHCKKAVQRDGGVARCRVLMPASSLIVSPLGRIREEHYRAISAAVKRNILKLCQ